ncbi:flavin reductase family protein [Desulfosarcina sp. OttesenSCG-928-A07]|nr:flavin reductase family protein [Desulfosarcina sp. OttesenSCG-928-G17]MDL2328175.1 flavin reductase family protein [Desulfosarcina sp. OttesenSCG-928-A07]
MENALLENMRHLTYGIYVLTTRFEDAINGMIASWVSQVSFDPPLFMAAVHPNRYSHRLMLKSSVFALHLVDQSQKDLLIRFKGPDPRKKFEGLNWTDGKNGCPILADCMGVVECRIIQNLSPGNHTLFIGQATHAEFRNPRPVLSTLDYEGCYLGKA